MASIQRRGHTLIIEDSIWDRLEQHAAKRGESASGYTNAVLREALGMIPTASGDGRIHPSTVPAIVDEVEKTLARRSALLPRPEDSEF